MNCIYIIKKITGEVYCKKYKKKITNECRICELKEFAVKEQKRLKQITKKRSKLESERFSLFTKNMNKCYLCHSTYEVHPHEIFGGARRQISARYGVIIPLCNRCHSKYQNNAEFNDYWHILGQKKFEEVYPELNFLDVFKINYL